MDESFSNLPTSHVLGSVPAVVSDQKPSSSYEVPEANLQIFPPNTINSGGGGGGIGRGYQTIGNPPERFEEQPQNNWKGIFNVSSYTSREQEKTRMAEKGIEVIDSRANPLEEGENDATQGPKDVLPIPQGPLTRARSKKLQDELTLLILKEIEKRWEMKKQS